MREGGSKGGGWGEGEGGDGDERGGGGGGGGREGGGASVGRGDGFRSGPETSIADLRDLRFEFVGDAAGPPAPLADDRPSAARRRDPPGPRASDRPPSCQPVAACGAGRSCGPVVGRSARLRELTDLPRHLDEAHLGRRGRVACRLHDRLREAPTQAAQLFRRSRCGLLRRFGAGLGSLLQSRRPGRRDVQQYRSLRVGVAGHVAARRRSRG